MSTKQLTTLLAVAVVSLLCRSAQAQAQATLVISGATLRTPQGDAVIDSIVIRNGKISKLSGVAPAGATVIDGKGKIVTAGLVAVSTHLGLVEIDAVGYTNEGQFDNDNPVHAAFQVIDGYNPSSMVIAVARNGGITSMVTSPGGGLVSGQSAWLTLGDSGSVADNTVISSTALHVTLGRRASKVGEGSRGLALQRLRALLDDAAHYSKNVAAYNRGQTRKYGAGHLDLQALQRVLQRKIPMVISVDRKSDIEAVIRLAKEFKIRVVLQSGAEAWLLAKELAANKIAVILNPKSNLPSSFDHTRVVDDAAARLSAAGVSIIISPIGGASSARTLRQLAGLAVAHGLPKSVALAAITTTPANVFGAPRGTLKVGAAADLVLWSGDPLELSTRPDLIIIGGTVQSMENHQTKLLQRYR